MVENKSVKPQSVRYRTIVQDIIQKRSNPSSNVASPVQSAFRETRHTRQKTWEKRPTATKLFKLPDVQDGEHSRAVHATHVRTKSFKVEPVKALHKHFGPLSPQASHSKPLTAAFQQTMQSKKGRTPVKKFTDSYVAL